MRAELELAADDGEGPPIDLLLGDVKEALEQLGAVETAALAVVRVLVVDDDERLGQLTARALRRLGYEADASASLRPLHPDEVLVLDLGVLRSLTAAERKLASAARPIVMTGAADPGSRALAEDICACDYLVKPVDAETLAAAINRRKAAERP